MGNTNDCFKQADPFLENGQGFRKRALHGKKYIKTYGWYDVLRKAGPGEKTEIVIDTLSKQNFSENPILFI